MIQFKKLAQFFRLLKMNSIVSLTEQSEEIDKELGKERFIVLLK